MKLQPFLKQFGLVVLGAILSISPAHATDDPLIVQAGELIHEALNPGGDPPPVQDQIDLLKKAKKLLEGSAMEYHGQRSKAIEDLRGAIGILKQGVRTIRLKICFLMRSEIFAILPEHPHFV